MNRSRRALLGVGFCLLVSPAARGEEVIRSVRWDEVEAAGRLGSGAVVEGSNLRVVHDKPVPATFSLATVERPGIDKARYALRGRVKHHGVAAGSHLEMWNHLPDGAFFSRALDRSGPMGRLDGSSGWRDFVLPFFNREDGSPPQKLVFNLVLTGAGSVEIGPLELVQFEPNEDVLARSGGWWTEQQAGVLGAVAGSAIGILGTVVGWLVSCGRAKSFVLATLQLLGWLGVGALVSGVFALARGQTYAVVYPLLLAGVISAALGFSLRGAVSRRYEERELRRMQALDV
jgi:hypothetical protein